MTKTSTEAVEALSEVIERRYQWVNAGPFIIADLADRGFALSPTAKTEPNAGKYAFSREWCINMAKQEGGAEIGAGMPDHPLRALPEPSAAGLHPETADLVDRFATALKEKLLASQNKYGWAVDWKDDDWQQRAQASLVEHISKGDPRDVAAYCAFLWHHGWPTALSAPTRERDLQEGLDAASNALLKAASVFSYYATLHKEKSSKEGDQKAAKNMGYYLEFEEAAEAARNLLNEGSGR